MTVHAEGYSDWEGPWIDDTSLVPNLKPGEKCDFDVRLQPLPH